MWISYLSLRNFRNYTRLELELPPGMVLLVAGNGQGKTNLLEALYLLATSRSPRVQSDRELIAWPGIAEDEGGGPPVARVAAEVGRKAGPVSLAIALQARPELGRGAWPVPDPSLAETRLPSETSVGYPGLAVDKHIRINGTPRRAMDLIGQLTAVLFRAQDMELVEGPPAERRRYLDAVLSAADPRYLRAFQRYQRVLLQRNHLLRRIGEGRARPEPGRRTGPDEMEYWDQELMAQGSYLLQARLAALGSLETHARETQRRLTGGREDLALEYVSTVPSASGDVVSLEVRFSAALTEARARELALGQTVVGPHRDDLRLFLNGVELSLYGSRGQQRTAALALRLAQGRYLAQLMGDTPILLLDDALTELDAPRRSSLLELAAESEQCFLTTTDPDRIAEVVARGDVTAYRVEGGRVRALSYP